MSKRTDPKRTFRAHSAAGDGLCCALCTRAVRLTAHHLIPRKLHRRPRFQRRYTRGELNVVVMLCEPCHRAVHRFHDEMTLGEHLNTLDALRGDPAIERHCAWVARQRRAPPVT